MVIATGVRKVLAGAAALGLTVGLAGGRQAEAHRRDFPYTYDWQQPANGEKEIELHSRYRERNNSFQQQIEFEYGVTNRLQSAAYLVFDKDSGGNLEYDEWKLQSRYQLTRFRTGKILPSLYAEYIGTRDGPDEIEGKLILSRYDKNGGDLSFNYTMERELEGGPRFENIYSVAYVRPLSRNAKLFLGKRGVPGGFEWIHNLDSERINAGPVFNFALSDSVWITSHYLFPVNNRGGNRGEFRMIVEYEWF